MTQCTASDKKGSIKVNYFTLTSASKLFMLYYNLPASVTAPTMNDLKTLGEVILGIIYGSN
jgi:hypothetical protein